MAIETTEYIKMLERMIKALGPRLADADEVELAQAMKLQEVLAGSYQVGVQGIRERGNSWAYIAQATGTTRQGAQQRWGR